MVVYLVLSAFPFPVLLHCRHIEPRIRTQSLWVASVKEKHAIVRLAPVVQTVDSAIRRTNHYPLDNSIGFASVYPQDSDLSGG